MWQYTALIYSFPVCCSMSSSNFCFLSCIQVSLEAGKVVWYSHLFKNFPQIVVIHTVKGFSIVNEEEVHVFLEFVCFFYDPTNVVNLISGSSAFSKSSLNIWKFSVHILLKPGLENLSITLLACDMTAIVWQFEYFFLYSSSVYFCHFLVGLIVTSSKRAYATPRSAAPRAPAPATGHC